ncbi:MAG: prephenate dehydratase [Magnetococcales bacterium]|nr:prephenate dehydratase [Magnetococcales bacterium]
MSDKPIIAFQGMPGAYSEQASREKIPEGSYLSCKSFEDVFVAVEEGRAKIGMIPVENSMAGVVSDSYDLLAQQNLHIIGEHFLSVRHALLALPGASITDIQSVYSHPQALAQCHSFLKSHPWERMSVYDTAGAAKDLVVRGRLDEAAVASALCSELYGLDILAREIQDSHMNTTRFILVSREPQDPPPGVPCKTSLIFEVRNIPAALYKCLGGFATNGVNLTRLESRPVAEKQWSYHFYLDFQGRPKEAACRLAMEELEFYTTSLKVLGCYPESPQPEVVIEG